MGFLDLTKGLTAGKDMGLSLVKKVRRPDLERQALDELATEKRVGIPSISSPNAFEQTFTPPVQSTFRAMSLLLPGVAPYQLIKGAAVEALKPGYSKNLLLGAGKGAFGQTSFQEIPEFKNIAPDAARFALKSAIPVAGPKLANILSDQALANLSELGIDIIGMSAAARAPELLQQGASKIPDLVKQRVVESIPSKKFRITKEMVLDLQRGIGSKTAAKTDEIIREIQSTTGMDLKTIWRNIRKQPASAAYIDINIPGQTIIKWADKPWWAQVKKGFADQRGFVAMPGKPKGFKKFVPVVQNMYEGLKESTIKALQKEFAETPLLAEGITSKQINEFAKAAEKLFAIVVNKIQPALNKELVEISKKFNTKGKVYSELDKEIKTGWMGTAKSVKSMVIKAIRKARDFTRKTPYGVESMKDHARGAVLIEDWKEAPAILRELKNRGFDVEITVDTPLNDFGYRGTNSSKSFGEANGETIIATPNFWKVKVESDKIYQPYRKYEGIPRNKIPEEILRNMERDKLISNKLWKDYWDGVPIELRRAIVAESSTGINFSGSNGLVSGSQAPSTSISALPLESRAKTPSSLYTEYTDIGSSPSNKSVPQGAGNVKSPTEGGKAVDDWVTARLKLKDKYAKLNKIPKDTAKNPWDDQTAQNFEKYAQENGLSEMPTPTEGGKVADVRLKRQINSLALRIPQVKGAGTIPAKTTSSPEEINNVVSEIDVAIKNNPVMFPLKDKPAITSNQDYGVSFDPENLCARGYSFTTALDGLRNTLADMPSGVKTEAGRKLLEIGAAEGLEVPCNQCYVAEKRILGSSAKSSEVGLSEYMPGEINKAGNKKFIQDAIVGMYSFGDFNPSHIPSITKFLKDLAESGLGAGTYTKNLNYLEIFGDTGIKFNVSSGKTAAVGIPLETIKPYLERYSNASVVYIGVNNADVLKIGPDPAIHHIIPAHIGPGTPKELLNMLSGLEWENFARSQSEKVKIGNREYNLFGNATETALAQSSKALEEAKEIIRKAMYTGNGFKYLMAVKKASKVLGQEITPKFPQFVKYDWYHKLIGSGQGEYGRTSAPVKIDVSKINIKRAVQYFKDYPIIRDDKIAEYAAISNKIAAAARSGGVHAIRALEPKKIDVSAKQFGMGMEGTEVGNKFKVTKPVTVKDANTGETKVFEPDGKPVIIKKKVLDEATKRYEWRIEDGEKAWVTLEDLEKFGEYEAAPDKIRGFITTVKGAQKTAPEVAQTIDSRYIPGVNKEMVAKASLLVESDPSEAYRLANMEDPAVSELPYIQVVSTLILDKAQAAGNFAEAKRIVDLIARRGTSSGQSSQVLAIYERLSPEGVLRYANSVIEDAKSLVSKEKLDQWEKLVVGLTSDKEKEALAKKLGIPYLSEDLMSKLYDRTINIKSIGTNVAVTEEIRNDIIQQLKQSAGILKLSPKVSNFILGESIKNLDEKRMKLIEIGLLLKDITREIPVDMWDKVAFVQTLSMLLNPKTAIRNMLGNLGFWAVENLTQTIGAGLDVVCSFMTGKRTLYCPNFEAQWKGASEGWGEGLQEALLGIDIGSNVATRYQLPKNSIFDSGVMGGLEKTLSVELRAPDKAFYKAAFNDTLQADMKAAGITEPTFEMLENAHFMGLYRTFQDDSALATMLVTIKRAFNTKIFKTIENKKWEVGRWGAGDMVLKFPKVPGNLASRGIEYSPFGFGSSLFYAVKGMLGKGFDQKTFTWDTSRAAAGTIFYVGTGALLATLGIISAKRLKDLDAQEMVESSGLGAYKINLSALKRFVMSGFSPSSAVLREGDIWASYDWFQPHSVGIAMGANMADSENANVVDAIIEASNTLVEQPVLQGVQQIQKGESIIRNLGNMAKGIPASFVPTLLNQVKQLTDNVSRETRDPNYFKEVLNKVVYKIPWISKTLPERVNTWGEKKEVYQAGSNNPFNVFLNPAFVSKYNPSGEAKLVLDIWRQSGETIQFPRKAPKSIMVQGKRRDLTPDEQRMFQEYIGTKTGILYRILYNDPMFMKHSDENKAKKLQGFLTDIYSAAKVKVLGIDIKQSKNVMQILRDISGWWKKEAYQREKIQKVGKRGFLQFVNP